MVAPAVAAGALLTLTVLVALVGVPLLLLTMPTVVLALQGDVRRTRPAVARPGLAWALDAFTVALLAGLAVSAVYGTNDLDQPEEVVVGALVVGWLIASALVTRTALARR